MLVSFVFSIYFVGIRKIPVVVPDIMKAQKKKYELLNVPFSKILLSLISCIESFINKFIKLQRDGSFVQL